MSKFTKIVSKLLLTQSESVDSSDYCVTNEWNLVESLLNCQNVNLGRGGGAR
ncbi:MAG: hypothetical protein LBJ00_03535 [Planctomycetaceae bacterium]|jgi:hypothetical protein|nr:hypothetical protein [Planctomycetaceae bacterium]